MDNIETSKKIREDRLNDLEAYCYELEQKLDKHTIARKNSSKPTFFSPFSQLLLLPAMLFFMILLGVDVSHDGNHTKISYSSDGLIEVGLLIITSVSGGYIAKKYKDEYQTNQGTNGKI